MKINEVEMSDKITGESFLVKEMIVNDEPVTYRKNYCEQSTGIGEINQGPYLVDDTGYVPLDEILKRCIRQGVNPIRPVDGVSEEEVMAMPEEDELSTGGTVPPTQVEPVGNSEQESSATAVDSTSHVQEENVSE